MQFHIPDMACDGCARSITLAIRALDPGAAIRADLGPRRIEVETSVPRETLAAALGDIGYAPAATGGV